MSGLGSGLLCSSSSSKLLSCSATTIGVSHLSSLLGRDDTCMDVVNLYHFEGSILLMSFPLPRHQYEHGLHYVLGLTMPFDSLGW